MQDREVYLASGRINLNLDNFAANQDNPQLAAQSSYAYQDEMSYQVKGLILKLQQQEQKITFSATPFPPTVSQGQPLEHSLCRQQKEIRNGKFRSEISWGFDRFKRRKVLFSAPVKAKFDDEWTELRDDGETEIEEVRKLIFFVEK